MKGDQTMAVSAAGLRVALLVSGYHAEVAESLRRGAVEAFAGAGGHVGEGAIAREVLRDSR